MSFFPNEPTPPNLRITKWGELDDDVKHEALLEMVNAILEKVGEGKVTDVSAADVKSLCGAVFKKFLPSGNWKGNVPAGVLRDLQDTIVHYEASEDDENPLVLLRSQDGFDEAALDWFDFLSQTSAKKELKRLSGSEVSQVHSLPTPQVRQLASPEEVFKATKAVESLMNLLQDEHDEYEHKVLPLKTSHKDNVRKIQKKLTEAEKHLNKCKFAAVEMLIRDAEVRRREESKRRREDDTEVRVEPPKKKQVQVQSPMDSQSKKVLKNLPIKFFNFLVKRGAISADAEVLNAVEVTDEELVKIRSLPDMTESLLNELENKYRVIVTPFL